MNHNKRNVYLIERYYIDQGRASFAERRRALRETMLAVGQWCTHYKAELLVSRNGVTEKRRSGNLPSDPAEKRQFMLDLLAWTKESSDPAFPETFNLMLDDSPISFNEIPEHDPKFTHFETFEWWLVLTSDEFTKLQATWRAGGLPEDLYYPQELDRWIEVEKTGWRKMLPGTVTKRYTPKYWELMKGGGQENY